MQRKLSVICLALSMLCFLPRTFAQRGKSEFSLGYSYYSVYSFANKTMNNSAFSASGGTPNFSYRYYLNRNVTLGVGLGYENISSWGSFFTIAPEMTVAYMDTRKDYIRVRLYGALSYGVSIMDDNITGIGETDESGPKFYAFQVTPIGVRVGRQVAGFFELGFGYKGIFNGGLSFRFPRKLKPREPIVD